LPSVKEIEALHRRYAPSQNAFDAVYTHCQIVWDIAQQLMGHSTSRFIVDEKLVRVGALLHDIGVYRLYTKSGNVDKKNYIQHGVLGYKLLKDEDFSEIICRFASNHTGVGLTKEDIVRQGHSLPLRDLLADSDEELLVMYADKYHTKSEPPCFNTANHCRQQIVRFGEDKVVRLEAMMSKFGIPDVDRLAKKYGHQIRT
jgi:uncharacterized protein